MPSYAPTLGETALLEADAPPTTLEDLGRLEASLVEGQLILMDTLTRLPIVRLER